MRSRRALRRVIGSADILPVAGRAVNNSVPLFSRDESLSKSMVRAKPRALVNAIYQTLRKPLMPKQFNRDEGDKRDVSLQKKAF